MLPILDSEKSMKNTTQATNKYQILLWIFIIVYIVYFSWFTILRYQTLYASYFDLGIMHQTVYNTYMAIKTGDWSRFLEMTNIYGPEQIKRMAIHNDLFLALLAPLYFIYQSPATLLVIQALVLGLGTLAVYKIAGIIFKKNKYKNQFSLLFSLTYLLYPPLQLANIFEFHAVTLSTTFLLFMFHFWLSRRYNLSFLFFALALLTKEQVALTTSFFGIYLLFFAEEKNKKIAYKIIFFSLIWFLVSVFLIIPYFRSGNEHFALKYFDWAKENPLFASFKVIANPKTYSYLFNLLGPLGFLSLLSPIQLLIALPELAINLFSKNPNLRNIIYHYTSVITPFVFISAIYGLKKLTNYKLRIANYKTLSVFILTVSLIFAYFRGPLPFAKSRNIHPVAYPQKEKEEARIWSGSLKDDNIKISTTGHLAPLFSGRRYFYNFSKDYKQADYVVIQPKEVYNTPEKNVLIPAYQKLILDPNYRVVYQKENFEVYKRITNNQDTSNKQ